MSGKLFCVRFDSNLFIGLLSGIAMLLLSFGMNCFPGTVFSVLFLRSIRTKVTKAVTAIALAELLNQKTIQIAIRKVALFKSREYKIALLT